MPDLRAVFVGKYLEPVDVCPDRQPRRVTIDRVVLGEAKVNDDGAKVDFLMFFRQFDRPVKLKKGLYEQIAKQLGYDTDQWNGQEIGVYPIWVEVWGEQREYLAVSDGNPMELPEAESVNMMARIGSLKMERARALPGARGGPQHQAPRARTGTFNPAAARAAVATQAAEGTGPRAAVKTIPPEAAQRFWNACNGFKTGPQDFVVWAKTNAPAAHAALIAHFKGESSISVDPARWPLNSLLTTAMKQYLDHKADEAERQAAGERVNTETGEVIEISEDEIPF